MSFQGNLKNMWVRTIAKIGCFWKKGKVIQKTFWSIAETCVTLFPSIIKIESFAEQQIKGQWEPHQVVVPCGFTSLHLNPMEGLFFTVYVRDSESGQGWGQDEQRPTQSNPRRRPVPVCKTLETRLGFHLMTGQWLQLYHQCLTRVVQNPVQVVIRRH